MPAITFGTIVKLLIWSFVIGAVLAFLNIYPSDLFGWIRGWLTDLVDNLQFYTNRVLTYILLGAVVVVPIWGISYLLRAFRR